MHECIFTQLLWILHDSEIKKCVNCNFMMHANVCGTCNLISTCCRRYVWLLYNCSNYVSSQEHIFQKASLIHHSIYLIPEQEYITHISVLCLKCHSICLFPVHNKYGLLQPYVRDNHGHARCAYTPIAPPGFDFSIYMAGYKHVSELHACKCGT